MLRNLFATAASIHELAHNLGLCPESEREVYSRLYGNPFRQWLNSDVPIAGKPFRELTLDMFRKNQLAHGRMIFGRQSCRASQSNCPSVEHSRGSGRDSPAEK